MEFIKKITPEKILRPESGHIQEARKIFYSFYNDYKPFIKALSCLADKQPNDFVQNIFKALDVKDTDVNVILTMFWHGCIPSFKDDTSEKDDDNIDKEWQKRYENFRKRHAKPSIDFPFNQSSKDFLNILIEFCKKWGLKSTLCFFDIYSAIDCYFQENDKKPNLTPHDIMLSPLEPELISQKFTIDIKAMSFEWDWSSGQTLGDFKKQTLNKLKRGLNKKQALSKLKEELKEKIIIEETRFIFINANYFEMRNPKSKVKKHANWLFKKLALGYSYQDIANKDGAKLKTVIDGVNRMANILGLPVLPAKGGRPKGSKSSHYHNWVRVQRAEERKANKIID